MDDRQFDPTVQTHYDGPLTDDFVKRVRSAKKALGLSFKDVADKWGISPAWAERILALDVLRRLAAKPSTATVERFVLALQNWETAMGKEMPRNLSQAGPDAAFHIGALNALGFEVSLRPLAK